MTDNVEKLLLEHLCAMRARIDRVAGDVRKIKHRLVTVESGIGTVNQHIGHLQQTIAGQQVSFDRLTDRVERIECRFELA